MNHRWAILCSNASVDKDSNGLSLFNLIEEMQIGVRGSAPPSLDTPLVAPLQSVLVIVNERSDSEKVESGTGRVRFIDPDGNELGTNLFKIELADHERMRTLMRFQNMSLTSSGLYKFIIEYQGDNGEWEEKDVVPLKVSIDFTPSSEDTDPQSH